MSALHPVAPAVLLGLLLGPLSGCPSPTTADDDDSVADDDDSVTADDDDDDTAGDDDDSAIEYPDLVGRWVEPDGLQQLINETKWVEGLATESQLFHTVWFSNEQGTMVGRNDSTNRVAPDLWSRHDWHWQEGALWFCHTAHGEETPERARALPAPSRAEVMSSGCHGGPWRPLSPAP